jgi:hypothetical protein
VGVRRRLIVTLVISLVLFAKTNGYSFDGTCKMN